MRRFLIAAVFLAGASSGFGQSFQGDNRGRDAARRDRALLDRTLADLDRASQYPFGGNGDRKRLEEASRKVFDFELDFNSGRYVKHELDDAIKRLQQVVARNSLDPLDRAALDEDWQRLREFRNSVSPPGSNGH